MNVYARFERFALAMTKEQAFFASHPGPCDEDVAVLLENKNIQRELNRIDPALIREELAEYGAWDDEELTNNEENHARILWIAAGDIRGYFEGR